jgi:hypothetical protein
VVAEERPEDPRRGASRRWLIKLPGRHVGGPHRHDWSSYRVTF